MNTFGRIFRVSIFGESHGAQIGVLLDGVPEGIELNEKDFVSDIARRAPGTPGTTSRKEADTPVILSGVYEGHTTGAPLTVIFGRPSQPRNPQQFFDACGLDYDRMEYLDPDTFVSITNGKWPLVLVLKDGRVFHKFTCRMLF